jgi:Fe-S-cluster containining protein
VKPSRQTDRQKRRRKATPASSPRGPSTGAGVSGPDLEARRSQRLQTVELLRGGRTPLQVITVAERAANLADRAIAETAASDPPDPPLACREGCAWCCHRVVGVSAPEVLRVVAFLRDNLSAPELQAARDRVAQTEARRRALRHDGWAAARLPCPLLVDGRCSVYPARPLTCRGYNSSDAHRCESFTTSRQHVEVPVHVPQQRLATLMLDGVLSGVTESGLRGELLELTAALQVALGEPDAAERWLRGEPVFTPARLS